MSTELSLTWIPRKRKYEAEKKSVAKASEPCSQDPLKAMSVTIINESKQQKEQQKDRRSGSSSSTSQPAFIDPLNQPLAAPPLTETAFSLSKMVADVSFKEKQERLKQNEIASSFEPWSLKKSSILAKYTTLEKLSITSSFLTPIAGTMMKEKAVAAASVTQTDKIKNRLEQLEQYDHDENLQEMSNLSQQEYVKRIDELNNALQAAWAEDDRVKSLKIVIQCSKLLIDTSVIQFYPSKFVLITDTLDSFGRLVYERIKSKSTYIAPGSAKPQPLPENFTCDIVPATAKETCRNWFFKIASIRELLPRIYVEASILKCTRFISDDSISKPLSRLISMCSGIGDPLIAAFAKCYICRVGVSIDTSIRDYHALAFNNLLAMFKQISSEKVRKLIQNQKIDSKTYLELYCPAIDWILQCLCYARNSDFLKETLEKCVAVSNENKIVNGLLINSMMTSFEPNFLSLIADKLIELINRCDDEYFPKHLLFRNLGLCLIMNSENSSVKYELALLNGVWKTVTKFTEPSNYMSCAEIWIEFTLKYFTKKEINTLLGDIIKHVQQDRVFENFYPQLQSIVAKILVYITDFSILFSMDKFMQFFNLFQKESVKLEVCKSITYGFLRAEKNFNEDIVVMNSMMQICKSMHDYVNALTLEDEKREISQMICAFLNKVETLEKDKIEQYLNFYSDARASFSNLDNVIALLVHKVNNLAMETLKAVRGQHTRKTGAFVRACTAYAFISIPSLTNTTLKLQLYLESAHVALQNQCLSQCDAHVKSALSLAAEAHKQTPDPSHTVQLERYLGDYLSALMSTLLAVPDNPDQGVLYLLTGLLNLVQKHLVWQTADIKFTLLLNALGVLSALKQESHLYGVNDVEANDTLYGSDVKYFREVNSLIDSVVTDLVTMVQSQTGSKQSQMALDVFNRLLAHQDLSEPKVIQNAYDMWTLGSKHGSNKYQENILNAIKIRAASNNKYENSGDYKTLLSKILAK